MGHQAYQNIIQTFIKLTPCDYLGIFLIFLVIWQCYTVLGVIIW